MGAGLLVTDGLAAAGDAGEGPWASAALDINSSETAKPAERYLVILRD
jgi:hypothetical protein